MQRLISYMTNPQNKQERVGFIRITNCFNHELAWVKHEIEATQAQNQRAIGDKTYHLLISFPAGECPIDEVLKDIEKTLCDNLGFSAHQRVSAIHYDTDNMHIHVAINKIHPKKLTFHEPYLAYKTLAKTATALELKHQLQTTNHAPKKSKTQNHVDDMEAHSNTESLLSFIQNKALPHLIPCQDWRAFHQVLKTHALSIKPYGNGLVFIDNQTGIAVKVSAVSNHFSKSKLEARLGEFKKDTTLTSVHKQAHISNKPPVKKIGQPPPVMHRNKQVTLRQINPLLMDEKKYYQNSPIDMDDISEKDDLFSSYQYEKINAKQIRKKEMELAKHRKNKAIQYALTQAKLRKIAIKNASLSAPLKKRLFALLHKELNHQLQKARLNCKKERTQIYGRTQLLNWSDWLKKRADDGDDEALTRLRKYAKSTIKGNIITHDVLKNKGTFPIIKPDSITKSGVIIYRFGQCTIRDNGKLLNVSRGSTHEGLKVALMMAIYRYGTHLNIQGSDEFKKQIVHAALSLPKKITFSDTTMDALSKTLTTQKEKKHEYRIANRGHATTARISKYNKRRGATTPLSSSNEPCLRNKPNVERIGTKPPPERKNGLRRLPELRLVQLRSRSEVLLSGDVSYHMEHQRAQSDNRVRRDVPSTGELTKMTLSPDEKYIKERNDKRQKITDILTHRPPQSSDEGAVIFSGIRMIDNQPLALLKRDNEILVTSIDEKMAKSLKRLTLGDNLKWTSKGISLGKGRSR